MAAHVIRNNHFIGREDRTDLRIEGIKGTRCKRLRFRHMKFAAGFPLLRLDQDEDWHMIWMGTRPLPHLLQTSREWLTGAPIVDVLDVHHLESRFAHHSVGIEVRIRRKLRSSNHRRPRRMGVEPAFAISVDIKFDLTNPAIELLRKRLKPCAWLNVITTVRALTRLKWRENTLRRIGFSVPC